MKYFTLSLALLFSIPISAINANQNLPADSNPGPMNTDWFYDQQNPYKEANQLLQEQQWSDAEKKYVDLLSQNAGSEYDQDMAKVNLASCQTAQRKKAPGWQSFDRLMGIPKERQLSQDVQAGDGKTVLVRTDKIGTGDIFHFAEAAAKLQKAGYQVVFSVLNRLKPRFEGIAEKYRFKLVGEKDEQPETDYETTLPGLYGHLNMSPEDLSPDSAMSTADEETLNKIHELVNLILKKNRKNKILFLFLGDNRAATLMGGKQLPRDSDAHGRHLESAPVNELLKKNPELYVVDCGFGDSKLKADDAVKGRVLDLPRDKAFDTFVAAAIVMSKQKRMVGIGADNGPTNVFARSLDPNAQNRMGIVIPNSNEYDMRMHGDASCPKYKKYPFGERYIQMLSKCFVYKCNTPKNQTEMLAQAYAELIKNGEPKSLFSRLRSIIPGK